MVVVLIHSQQLMLMKPKRVSLGPFLDIQHKPVEEDVGMSIGDTLPPMAWESPKSIDTKKSAGDAAGRSPTASVSLAIVMFNYSNLSSQMPSQWLM